MPWPLQCQVPPAPLAISVSSAGGFISGIAAALSPAAGAAALGSALAAAFMSPALGSALGCAAASAVMPTIATATRKNVFMIMLLGKNARTILKRDLLTSRRV